MFFSYTAGWPGAYQRRPLRNHDKLGGRILVFTNSARASTLAMARGSPDSNIQGELRH